MNMSLQSELKHSPVVTSHFHQSEMWKMESEDEDQTPEPGQHHKAFSPTSCFDIKAVAVARHTV